MTELAQTVEHLQNQNLEKDRINKALTEKLEALVRCSYPWDVQRGMGHWPGPGTWGEGRAAWAALDYPLRLFHPLLIEHLVCARLSVSTSTSFVPFHPVSGHAA